MIPVPPPLRHYGQTERATRVKDVMIDLDKFNSLDVVIMSEVIAPIAQTTVLADMEALGYKYRTSKMNNLLSVSGGIYIFSKHEITHEEISTFGDKCNGIDCFAAKGVVYARVKKQDMFFNVFATHMQAWPHVKSQLVRDGQIEQIYKFIQSLHIPKNEPVLFGGDMNIDLYMNNDHIKHLLYRLKMEIPEIHPQSHPFTVDPKENKMVGNDDPYEYQTEEWPEGCMEVYYETLECPCCPAEWIDYIVFSKYHLLPIESWLKAIKVKVPPFRMYINRTKEVEIQDVSDHFPVLGHFVFPKTPINERVAHDKLEYGSIQLSSNSMNIAYIVIIVVLGLFIFIVIVYFVYQAYQRKKSNLNYHTRLKVRKTLQ